MTTIQDQTTRPSSPSGPSCPSTTEPDHTIESLQCPHCDSGGLRFSWTQSRVQITCLACGASSPMLSTVQESAAAWYRTKPDPRLEDLINAVSFFLCRIGYVPALREHVWNHAETREVLLTAYQKATGYSLDKIIHDIEHRGEPG